METKVKTIFCEKVCDMPKIAVTYTNGHYTAILNSGDGFGILSEPDASPAERKTAELIAVAFSNWLLGDESGDLAYSQLVACQDLFECIDWAEYPEGDEGERLYYLTDCAANGYDITGSL